MSVNAGFHNIENWCPKGHFNEDQSQFFAELIIKQQPQYAIETGFCTGRSALSVLEPSTKLKKLISIDINLDYHPMGRLYARKLEINYPNFQVRELNSAQLFETTNFLSREYPDGIDWATIDGDHSYHGCLKDLQCIFPHMKSNGIMIVDDYESGPPGGCCIPQVTKACDDFYNQNTSKIYRTKWNNNGKGFCIFQIL